MHLWKYFTVSPLRSACLAVHQTAMKTKGRQMQRACKTRWLSSEATVRASQRWATATLLIASLPLPLFVKFNSGATASVTE